MVNKKGQMKIQQMAFMLIALMLFFGLIAVLVLAFQMSKLRSTATELGEQEALLLVSKLSNSPEFSCENAFSTSRTSCVDLDKIMALKSYIGVYEDYWGVSAIEVRKTYPLQGSEVECAGANYPNCNLISLVSNNDSGIGVENFVALCRKESEGGKVYDKCELGKLIVSYDIK